MYHHVYFTHGGVLHVGNRKVRKHAMIIQYKTELALFQFLFIPCQQRTIVIR